MKSPSRFSDAANERKVVSRLLGRAHQPERNAAGDFRHLGGHLWAARPIPWLVRRELELAVPITHDDSDEH